MKSTKAKQQKLKPKVIYDFSNVNSTLSAGVTLPTQTDPTTVTVTIITSTAHTQKPAKMLT